MAAAACGARIFVPPTGPGTPTDASSAWTSVTKTCRSATSYVGELRVSGRAGSRRIARLRIETAVTRDQIYMNATVSGQTFFVLAGSSSEATLWLRHDRKVVKAPAGDIVEAILGLSVPPDRLFALLTGCVTRSFDVTAATSYGQRMAVQTPDARVYLEQTQTGWQTLAGEAEGFVVELKWQGGAVPERLWLNSIPGREPRASLAVTAEGPNLNEAVPASFFAPPAGAASAEPMTIEELRAAGPWRKG